MWLLFESVFYLEMHQNNFFIFFKNYFWYQLIKILKIQKKNSSKEKKIKLKKKTFKTQKQTKFYKTQLKKHIKTVLQKLHFKLNFLMGLII